MLKATQSHIFWLLNRTLHCLQVAQRNNVVVYASALAFNTLISLIPLIAISAVILFKTPWAQTWATETLHYALHLFSFGDKEALVYMERFSAAMTNMSLTYLSFWLITNVLLFTQIQYVLNHIFECPQQRSFIKSTLASLLLILILPFLLLAGFLAKFIFSAFLSSAGLPAISAASKFSTFFLDWIICVIIYKVFPNRTIHLKSALIGGAITSALLILSKDIFLFYIVAFPTYSDIYGRFATIPILMIWISIMWLIILFGATIVAEIESNRALK
jgi:membrane protein